MKQIEIERLKMREIDLTDAEGFFELDSNHSCGLQKNSHYIAAVAFIFIRSILSLIKLREKQPEKKALLLIAIGIRLLYFVKLKNILQLIISC